MPLFLEIHTMAEGVSLESVATMHPVGATSPSGLGATCLRSWVSAPTRKVICLVEADDPDVARAIHASSVLTIGDCIPVVEHP